MGRDAGLSPRDEWSAIVDPSERRKRQNRVHQRAWRQKRKAGLVEEPETSSKTAWTGRGVLVLKTRDWDDESRFRSHPAVSSNSQKHPSLQTRSQSLIVEKRGSRPPRRQPLIPPLIPDGPLDLHQTLRVVFPISPDHHLITLIQYNVKRAFHINMEILGLHEHVPEGQRNSLALPRLPVPIPASIPPSLEPTELQLTVPHNFLYSTVPFPAVRDNLIRYDGAFDLDALCSDVYGGLFEGLNDLEARGIMIWGDPWKEEDWEVTEEFAKKWRFLLEGCDGVIEATNRWRQSRGEEPLVFEV